MFSGWDEYHLINDELAALARTLPDSPLGEIIGYVLTSPGKRVRPLILLFSAQAFGGTARQAMNAALAVELVHAASLVHDDILDLGVERRGAQSVFERYGPEAALLAGDWLISRSIDLVSGYSQPVIKAFSRACMDMAEGELLDMSAASSPDDYYQCISRKTATLFSASAGMGVLIAGGSGRDVACFEDYGRHLGLGYQVLDDLEEFLGLDQGKSSQKTSVTLPRIYSSIQSGDAPRQMCLKAIEDSSRAAKAALDRSAGGEGMKARLKGIVDEMTGRGLLRCRLQKSLC
ncbi:MAG TPA: polyprenyl synthetase family protein [Methanothrix sp.]|nr:polyprenyl synthetase family protein [Methanothrix sp.]